MERKIENLFHRIYFIEPFILFSTTFTVYWLVWLLKLKRKDLPKGIINVVYNDSKSKIIYIKQAILMR